MDIKFSEKLKELRKEKGLTQIKISQVLGVSATAYAGYEQGYREPPLSIIKDLADFFECSIDYLIGRTDDFGVISISNPVQQLTEEERELLATFRKLDMLNRLHVSTYANVRLENQTGGAGGNRRA